ncbi:MAG: hypothetical protein MPJ24_07865 [Pirellulaceae bacterium]|nr:hypothetical protein [Pirellulaceae bacterium]
MPKIFCILGLAVAGLIGTISILDFIPGIAPFGGASLLMDITGILGSGALAYLSWSTLRSLK